MPLLAAREVEAWRVEWAENMDVSIPAAANSVLIHRPKDWEVTGLYGGRVETNKESTPPRLRLCVRSRYDLRIEKTHNSGFSAKGFKHKQWLEFPDSGSLEPCRNSNNQGIRKGDIRNPYCCQWLQPLSGCECEQGCKFL